MPDLPLQQVKNVNVKKSNFDSGKRLNTVLVIPDIHHPFADSSALKLTLKISRVLAPTDIYFLGDYLDGYSLSKYPVDPSSKAARFKDELPPAKEFLSTLRSQNPTARIKFIEGNHCQRIKKWLQRNPALLGLPQLEIPFLLDFEKYRIEPVLYPEIHITPDYVLTHGSKVAGDSGQSAKKELLARFKSGGSGHTHRACTFRYRASDRLLEWTEFGHLAMNPLSYMDTPGNWCQAVGYLEVSKGQVFTNLFPFTTDYKCRIGGKIYAA